MRHAMRHATEMRQVRRCRDAEVTAIRQWRDPFGAPMVRIGVDRDGDAPAAGLPEAECLAAAELLRAEGPELVEGAR